jgi:hypothetical protein
VTIFEKISRWRRAFFVWVGLPVIAAIGFSFGMFDLVPAWQAKAGKGTEGTFTAVREDCGGRSCTWYGDFVAADGGKRRTDVILYDEPDGMVVGQQVAARDTGARNGVFAADGGYTWLIITGLVVGGLVAAVAWVLILIRAIRRRRAPAPTA